MELYTYYRSTSSYRVRIALALKGLDYQALPVNLIAAGGGEHRQAAYLAINPQGRVPALRTDTGHVLTQSPAIIEFLEERYPQVPLLSRDLPTRAHERAVAALIGCDIHPLHNVSVLNLLRQWGHDEEQVQTWIGHWISQGLAAVEQLIGDIGYCFGNEPGLADVYLIPQLYAAERFKISLEAYPRIRRVAALAQQHPAFIQAHPANQPDTPA
ncbi:maleylacetoacetate isomerase [Pseudomonas gingeri NCPPB 3146 = LMG 5327]|uniref:Maleylacetoacetate isomerase n=2 Tax=Pseudomonas gingeri TaxID=117681 RepID=A0A7Y8CEL3_9PSED|nr:maleylacetoacetate isomerase [Pseudomonas gingeri]NWC15161.1 maleylacetoacetate isomerase [Pseudomonas gingeri]NWE50044.1 maleylacetoacetate isomerase [Pseudomonas gingeri]PNQ91557.1 maleylacetoacetate isomerase [Pseudomonas gingeri NCPPB 3146 = LMG 5327]